MNRQVVKAHVVQGPASRWAGRTAEPTFGVALVDRQGNLLGASTVSALPGEVEVPLGMNLREEDLRPYSSGGRGAPRGRRFPLVSATWVQVKSKQVRVGIYMEKGEWLVSPERLDLDLAAIGAILSSQVLM
ncbi:MAG: hypothetical protein V1912_11475 [bacterium]